MRSKGELGLNAGASSIAEAAASLGIVGGVEQRLAKELGVAGWDEPAGLAGDDQVFAPLDGGGHDGAAGGHRLEDHVGHPLPERGEDQHVGGLEQRRDVVAAAEPVDPVGQRRRSRATRCQEPGAVGAVAGQDQVPVGPRGDHPLGGGEQVGSPFWTSSRPTASARRAPLRHADRRARPGLRRGRTGAGVDAVGDHGQAVRGDPAHVAAEPHHPVRDADRAGRQPSVSRSSVKCQRFWRSATRRPPTTQGDPGQRRGQPRRHVGVEQEALHQLRRLTVARPGPAAQTAPTGRLAVHGLRQTGTSPAARSGSARRPSVPRAITARPPAPAVEPRRQGHQRPLGAADVQVGDHQGDTGTGRSGQGPAHARSASRRVRSCTGRVQSRGRIGGQSAPAVAEAPDGFACDFADRSILKFLVLAANFGGEGSYCASWGWPGGRGLLTSEFDFDLPDELIAQHPVEPRDRSRLMVVRPPGRDAGSIGPSPSCPSCSNAGDVLVRNNTRVIPARLVGHREATGGRWEGLFLRAWPDGTWEVLATTRGRPSPASAWWSARAVADARRPGRGRALDRPARGGRARAERP